MKKVILIITFLLIISGLFIVFKNRDEQIIEPESNSSTQKVGENSQFDKSRYSIDDPASIWVIVNKNRPIPTIFIPSNLVRPDVPTDPNDSDGEQKINQEITKSVESMFSDAEKQGFNLILASGYRSAALQKTYYDNYVAKDGAEAANKYSAKPGTSEHQTGWAFDVARADRKCYLDICFGQTPEGKWLAENAYKYGFVLRYQEGKEDITGYQYEPWHFRYVGLELAEQINKSDQTLEEFFGL